MQFKFESAKTYYKQGQLAKAKDACLEVLKTQSNHLQSLRLLSLILFITKDYLKSANYLKKAINIDPRQASVHSDYGVVLHKLNEFDAAVKSYNKAIKINPNFAEAYNNLGNAEEELNKIDSALENYNIAIKINPKYAQAYSSRGNVLVKLKKLEEAIESYNKAIKINPKLFGAYYNCGIALEDFQKLEEAVKCYDKAIKINPNYTEAYNNRGNILIKLNKNDEAAKSYEEAIKINPNLDFLLGLLFFVKNILCDWQYYNKNLKVFKDKMLKKKKISPPFVTLSIVDSPLLQKISAEIWVKEKFTKNK